MTRITIDPEMRSKLRNLNEPLELFDDAGRLLGYFTPVQNRSLYEGIEPEVGEEELQRRERESGGYSTAEVLQRLKRLP